MKFNVISLFPDLFTPMLENGVVGQAVTKNKLRVNLINPRKYTADVHHTVDDRPFGGGDGMVMMAEPLSQALEELKTANALGHVVYLSPHGEKWADQKARDWAQESKTVTLICGRYGGIDQRIINEYVHEEISIGDYVLSGGELGAMVLIDSVGRFLPEVLGNADSPEEESFAQGLLEAPQWTRPREYHGRKVPDFLLSGNHKAIKEGKEALSWLVTAAKRPDLLVDIANVQVKLEQATGWLEGLSFDDKKVVVEILNEGGGDNSFEF